VDINKHKNTKRTQMIPLHTVDEICPSFLPMPDSRLLFLSWQKLLPKQALSLAAPSFSGL